LNASCALWYSEEHACLSVINLSKILHFWILGVIAGKVQLSLNSLRTKIVGV
jgi:hypothetical protein